ncbi:MAG: DUF429 domain-containing protein [Methylophilaceae bacterium]|nr:DUF429 domain-containing protein [Methylophilaceae bacterium]
MKTIGVDVGGVKKGFHAVANQNGNFFAKFHSRSVDEIVSWIINQAPLVVAIDAPSMFSLNGRSREAERLLVNHGVRCFFTPTRALAQRSHFYDWVFNGELLFQKLNLAIFMGGKPQFPSVIETFPHGIDLFFWANKRPIIPKISKTLSRKITLTKKARYETSELSNIDFIDAALCAISADYFARNQFTAYGSDAEGYIVLPAQSNNID